MLALARLHSISVFECSFRPFYLCSASKKSVAFQYVLSILSWEWKSKAPGVLGRGTTLLKRFCELLYRAVCVWYLEYSLLFPTKLNCQQQNWTVFKERLICVFFKYHSNSVVFFLPAPRNTTDWNLGPAPLRRFFLCNSIFFSEKINLGLMLQVWAVSWLTKFLFRIFQNRFQFINFWMCWDFVAEKWKVLETIFSLTIMALCNDKHTRFLTFLIFLWLIQQNKHWVFSHCQN